MPRNDDKLYLTDMVMAADDIAEFIIYGSILTWTRASCYCHLVRHDLYCT